MRECVRDCMCVRIIGVELLSPSFIYSFHICLEISCVPGRYDTQKCMGNYNSYQLKSLYLRELVHQSERDG